MGLHDRTPLERFVEKVEFTDGCWLWTAAKFDNGYGAFRLGPSQMRAHRWAYEQFFGPIPEGNVVMHTCDVRHCVNPAHLRAGTQKENQQDMVRKKRCASGVRHVNVLRPPKLSQVLADEIRERYANEDVTQQKLADEYGVCQRMISLIVRGERWNPASYLIR